jgi:hypothetical protein
MTRWEIVVSLIRTRTGSFTRRADVPPRDPPQTAPGHSGCRHRVILVPQAAYNFRATVRPSDRFSAMLRGRRPT